MTLHTVPMPAHPQPWTCSCGATAPLPLAVTWAAWDASVFAHLDWVAGRRACPVCGRILHRLGMGRHRATHKRYAPSGLDEFTTTNGKATP